MSNQILVPALGESITEATVSRWLKQVGEAVDSDEPLVELETDKVNIEVPSPLSGTLSSIKAKEGETVEVGALLGLLSEGKISEDKKTETQWSGAQLAGRSQWGLKVANDGLGSGELRKLKMLRASHNHEPELTDQPWRHYLHMYGHRKMVLEALFPYRCKIMVD